MDPNKALAEMRDLVKRAHLAVHGSDISYMADEMADIFEGLDEWLCKGGFLPDSWEIARKRAAE